MPTAHLRGHFLFGRAMDFLERVRAIANDGQNANLLTWTDDGKRITAFWYDPTDQRSEAEQVTVLQNLLGVTNVRHKVCTLRSEWGFKQYTWVGQGCASFSHPGFVRDRPTGSTLKDCPHTEGLAERYKMEDNMPLPVSVYGHSIRKRKQNVSESDQVEKKHRHEEEKKQRQEERKEEEKDNVWLPYLSADLSKDLQVKMHSTVVLVTPLGNEMTTTVKTGLDDMADLLGVSDLKDVCRLVVTKSTHIASEAFFPRSGLVFLWRPEPDNLAPNKISEYIKLQAGHPDAAKLTVMRGVVAIVLLRLPYTQKLPWQETMLGELFPDGKMPSFPHLSDIFEDNKKMMVSLPLLKVLFDASARERAMRGLVLGQLENMKPSLAMMREVNMPVEQMHACVMSPLNTYYTFLEAAKREMLAKLKL